MKTRPWVAWVLAGAVPLGPWIGAAAQQDEGPNLKPKAKPKPAGATLLVLCDLACDWRLDGDAMGRIEAGGTKKTPVSQGQHVVDAATIDGLDKVEQEVEIAGTTQKVVRVELQPVREARLKVEREEKARMEQAEAARMKELRDHAGERFEQGSGLARQKRFAEAKPLLEEACEGGSMDGCAFLGGLFARGDGVAPDYNRARELYEYACDGGSSWGCNGVGALYSQGHGFPQDYLQASIFFQKACDGNGGGVWAGCIDLGNLYENGQGVSVDFAKARSLYERACAASVPVGCYNLARMYQSGTGAPPDNGQARAMYKKACDMQMQSACDAMQKLP